ncbi:hypothetical protein [Polaromonas sp. AER18D-145]|uniref:hypothetical protein n=1 Tax=Polaromonas sp. AER18D-145 TaxID=1977060 RepID=UPI000BBBA3A0|nr:hypothetical protein [Polaromonas sp. AER18D-145]
MVTWLQNFPAIRSLPRLWVERVWLLASREPLEITRIVNLQPGVNIVWAREPDSDEGSCLASAGHGVGKTSFCLLLRYLLGDDATAVTALREKAAANFPKGGVAAKVNIDGVAWLVYRPYGAYSHSFAKIGDQLEDLFDAQIEGDFQTYLSSFRTAFIGTLAAQTLPGTNQELEWQHLLAWCVRDQKTRFDGFFHWREGDGLGFRRPRKDPPLFVNLVLGLLDAEADKLMRTVESTQAELSKIEAQIPDLEREPVFELARLERQLRARVGSSDDEPVHETTVESSLESRVRDVLARAEEAERKWEREAAAAENAMAPNLVKLAELQAKFTMLDLEKQQTQALVNANEAEYTRLTTAIAELDRLAGYCTHGLVDFSDCNHIKLRRAAPNLPWHMDTKAAKAAAPRLLADLKADTTSCESVQRAKEQQERIVNEQRAAVRRIQMRSATSATGREQLKTQWADFLPLFAQRQQGADSPELKRVKDKQKLFLGQLDSQKAALVQRRQQLSLREESLRSLTRCLAERLLGETGHGRFIADSDSRPFDLSVGGEAYQVLEVLLGDVTCLLDAATSTGSIHPGFLVHDCPREADMSAVLYRNFLMMASEADEQLANGGNVPFQYIVTTTSAPPVELRGARHVVLELLPGSEEHLLFKRALETSLPGMNTQGQI